MWMDVKLNERHQIAASEKLPWIMLSRANCLFIYEIVKKLNEENERRTTKQAQQAQAINVNKKLPSQCSTQRTIVVNGETELSDLSSLKSLSHSKDIEIFAAKFQDHFTFTLNFPKIPQEFQTHFISHVERRNVNTSSHTRKIKKLSHILQRHHHYQASKTSC